MTPGNYEILVLQIHEKQALPPKLLRIWEKPLFLRKGILNKEKKR
jgi:hypothetical protein